MASVGAGIALVVLDMLSFDDWELMELVEAEPECVEEAGG
jgi:hypothetical protein